MTNTNNMNIEEVALEKYPQIMVTYLKITPGDGIDEFDARGKEREAFTLGTSHILDKLPQILEYVAEMATAFPQLSHRKPACVNKDSITSLSSEIKELIEKGEL